MLNPTLPLDHPSWQSLDSTAFNHQFLYVYNTNPQLIIFLARLPIMVISVLLGLLIFVWARGLYGRKGGLWSLALYVFSPTILANAGFAMIDAASIFFITLAAFVYWKLLKQQRPTFLTIAIAGMCFGLAQSAKVNAVLLYRCLSPGHSLKQLAQKTSLFNFKKELFCLCSFFL